MNSAAALAIWALGLALTAGLPAAAPDRRDRPAGLGLACDVGDAPLASQPAVEPTSQPATEPAADPAVVKILDELEVAGAKYGTLQADVTHRVLYKMVGDQEDRTGRVAFRRAADDSPAMFYIRFDTLRQGQGAPIKDEVEYAFDGMWLTHVQHRILSMVRYQVVAEGQRADPLRLGKGPFPVPFGQKTEEVLKYFQASTRPPRASDPNGTDYVLLVTREPYQQELSFLRLQMWADRQTRLPVKLVSENRNKEVTTVVFSNVKTDAAVDPKIFKIPIKTGGGWQYKVVPLDKPAGGGG